MNSKAIETPLLKRRLKIDDKLRVLYERIAALDEEVDRIDAAINVLRKEH